MDNKIQNKLQEEPRRWIFTLLIVLVFVVLLWWSNLAITYNGMSERGPLMAKNILQGILRPDLGLLFGLTKESVPYLLLETFMIAFLGTILGTVIAVPLSFLTARNVAPKPVAFVMSLVMIAIRTFPSFVMGLIFIRVTGLGAFAGVLTMCFSSLGMLTKRNAEAVEDIDVGVVESLDAAGCTRFQKIRYGILPQLYSNYVSNMIYRFDINMKNAAVLGLVGAGGIGAPLIFNMNSFRWNAVGSLLIGLMVAVLLIEYISTRIRIKLARG